MKNFGLILLIFSVSPLNSKELSRSDQSYRLYTKKIAAVENNILDQSLKFYIPKEFKHSASDQGLFKLGKKLEESYKRSIVNLEKHSKDLKTISHQIRKAKDLTPDQVNTLSVAHVNGTNMLLKSFQQEIQKNYLSFTQKLNRKVPFQELYVKISQFSQKNKCDIKKINLSDTKLSFEIKDQKIELNEKEKFAIAKPVYAEESFPYQLSTTIEDDKNQYIFAQDTNGVIKNVFIKDFFTGKKSKIDCELSAAVERLPANN